MSVQQVYRRVCVVWCSLCCRSAATSLCYTLLHSTALYCTVGVLLQHATTLYSTALCRTLLHSAALYRAMLHAQGALLTSLVYTAMFASRACACVHTPRTRDHDSCHCRMSRSHVSVACVSVGGVCMYMEEDARGGFYLSLTIL